jgi:hypothetical protein
MIKTFFHKGLEGFFSMARRRVFNPSRGVNWKKFLTA